MGRKSAAMPVLHVLSRRMLHLLCAAAVVALSSGSATLPHFNVLVYGSSPGGIQAALSAASEGAAVVLVSPSARLGGMMSSGLGHTDKGNTKAIGGAAMKFFHDVCADDAAPPCWDFPPSRALALFQRMLAANPNITVIYHHSVSNVARDGVSVSSVTLQPLHPYAPNAPSSTVSGPLLPPLVVSADYFIDSSYEGDLIAAAGCAPARDV
jgi:NADPH-dependent 2,4-dienoyl-CoA reductase/sulfur reductase-like enzyme